MTASIIDGKAAAARLRASVAAEADHFARRLGQKPRLCVLIVGDNPASRASVSYTHLTLPTTERV